MRSDSYPFRSRYSCHLLFVVDGREGLSYTIVRDLFLFKLVPDADLSPVFEPEMAAGKLYGEAFFIQVVLFDECRQRSIDLRLPKTCSVQLFPYFAVTALLVPAIMPGFLERLLR